MKQLTRRLPRPVAVAACALVALLMWAGFTGLRQNNRLAAELGKARADLAESRRQIDGLNGRIVQLETAIRTAGLEVPPVPPNVTIIVPPTATVVPASTTTTAHPPERPPSTTTTTSAPPAARPSTTTTATPTSTTSTTTCRALPIIGCVP